MKSSKRKNVSKSSTPETKCNCLDSVVVGVLLTLLAVGLIGLAYYSMSGPKYEFGDCLLNRVGETLEVREVDTETNTYTLAPQQYAEGYLYYIAIRDYDKPMIQKEVEFVDERYVKVPCSR